jgi:hypothetical protein
MLQHASAIRLRCSKARILALSHNTACGDGEDSRLWLRCKLTLAPDIAAAVVADHMLRVRLLMPFSGLQSLLTDSVYSLSSIESVHPVRDSSECDFGRCVKHTITIIILLCRSCLLCKVHSFTKCCCIQILALSIGSDCADCAQIHNVVYGAFSCSAIVFSL